MHEWQFQSLRVVIEADPLPLLSMTLFTREGNRYNRAYNIFTVLNGRPASSSLATLFRPFLRFVRVV